MTRRTLGTDEFHIWTAFTDRVTAHEPLRYFETLLSADETTRYQRFHFDRHRQQFLLSHALVRTVLAQYVDRTPGALNFTIGSHGKPELTDASDLRFNLSHTDGLAALIVARGVAVGVDVEFRDRRPVSDELADRYFAPAEVAQLRALEPAARRERFFEFWTLKEAYIKARGLGLTLPLDAFAFHLGSPAATISFSERITDDPAAWQFTQSQPGPAHALATAIHRPGRGDLLPVTHTSWPDGFCGP